MLKEFKEFAMRGTLIDMAIGFIVGAAFSKIITSLVNDVLMPPIGLVLNRVNFSNLFLNLSGQPYTTLAEAQAAGAPTINYGVFLNTIIDFVIVAFVMFLLVKQINLLRAQLDKSPAYTPKTKDCPFCYSAIPLKAERCPFCTSELK